MKKFLAALLMGVVSFGVVGCGKKAADTKKDVKVEKEVKTTEKETKPVEKEAKVEEKKP